ncbi:MAG: DoxX family membrane protein [Actinobacteria bacterium]|nr:DoxX family membrane protein [Actinomycetota bacterium]
MSVTPAPRSGSAQPLVAAALRVTLGVLFLSVWASNLHKGLYSTHGYQGLIHRYVDTGSAPEPWKALMRTVADAAVVTSKAQLVTELAFGLFLLAGVATRLVALGAAFFLGSLWLSEIGVPHEWIWSLVFPTLVAFAVSLLSAGRVFGLDRWLLEREPLRRLPRWARG